jgi:hypothetical protein
MPAMARGAILFDIGMVVYCYCPGTALGASVRCWNTADVSFLTNVRLATVAAIVADKTACLSAGALPTTSAWVGKRLLIPEPSTKPARGSPPHTYFCRDWPQFVTALLQSNVSSVTRGVRRPAVERCRRPAGSNHGRELLRGAAGHDDGSGHHLERRVGDRVGVRTADRIVSD